MYIIIEYQATVEIYLIKVQIVTSGYVLVQKS